MRSPMQRKYAAKAAHGALLRQVVEKVVPLLGFVFEHKF